MLLGQPTKLQSQFRLTYSMILNLLRVEALRVEEMIKRSFSENAAQRLLPEHAKKVAEGESELKELRRLEPGPKTDELRKFYDLEQRIVELNTAVLDGVLAHPSSGRTMSTGRVVILSDGVRPPLSLSFGLSQRRADSCSDLQHFRDNPAVLLKSAPSAVLPSGVLDPTKQFFVLAFVPPEIREGKNGASSAPLSEIFTSTRC